MGDDRRVRAAWGTKSGRSGRAREKAGAWEVGVWDGAEGREGQEKGGGQPRAGRKGRDESWGPGGHEGMRA